MNYSWSHCLALSAQLWSVQIGLYHYKKTQFYQWRLQTKIFPLVVTNELPTHSTKIKSRWSNNSLPTEVYQRNFSLATIGAKIFRPPLPTEILIDFQRNTTNGDVMKLQHGPQDGPNELHIFNVVHEDEREDEDLFDLSNTLSFQFVILVFLRYLCSSRSICWCCLVVVSMFLVSSRCTLLSL